MSDLMTFPETWEEFEKSYGFVDSEEVYTNGSRLIPSFRVKQWLDHIAQSENKQQATVSSDCIYRKDAIEAIHEDADWLAAQGSDWQVERMERDKSILMSLPSAEKAQLSGEDATFDCISRQKVIDVLSQYPFEKVVNCISIIEELPSVEPEKENPRRVLWSGWKGTRYTRYKCPNCNKPVKNDDVHCHRCGQKLMFPHISHTPYIEGQKQELIVRWDDEE